MKCVFGVTVAAILLMGCSEPKAPEKPSGNENKTQAPVLVGKWIKESDGSVMRDPQTSGLAAWRGELVSLSDGSAIESQRRRIHVLEPKSAVLRNKPDVMAMSSRVRRSCFSAYLSNQPDLEALVVDPNDDSVFYVVTEDATRTGALSGRCQQQFSNTGSTDYPTLLVRVKMDESGKSTMTHVRPLRFATDLEVGDFPNDGIEGMAITLEGTLFLGLEKDKAGKARIFALTINEEFWGSSGFADVTEPNIPMPTFLKGNHPINALTYVPFKKDHPGFLIAAARNDDEIWILDLAGKQPAKRQFFTFAAEIFNAPQCGEHEIMDNSSIEGLAVIGDTLWLVNDPWKRNYLKNIQCPANAPYYEAMAPLLFSTPIASEWFE